MKRCLAYWRENGLGTELTDTRYRGALTASELIIVDRGNKLDLSTKRRTNHSGEQVKFTLIYTVAAILNFVVWHD
jgi:hypothetical protein